MSPYSDPAAAAAAQARRWREANPEKRREVGRRSYGSTEEGRIACLVCGEEMHNLGHHLPLHGITPSEYRTRFPDAQLTGEHLRAVLRDCRDDRDDGPGVERWPDDKIIAALRAWWRRTGTTPREGDWTRGTKSRPSAGTVKNHFGSWNAAMKAAGLPTRDPTGSEPRPWARRKSIPHGTISGYQHCKCRCPRCRAARSEYIGAWRAQKRLAGQRVT